MDLVLMHAGLAAAAGQGSVNVLLFLLFELCVVILVSRLIGWLFQRVHQPLVVGEIVAGVLLGPSFLGLLAPQFTAWLFPAETAPYLNILAQVGLIFFMFLVGLELNGEDLKKQSHTALVVSHVSIIAPFFLGVLLSLYIYESFSTNQVNFTSFALFMGASMSVTAFPVLARILSERRMTKTPIGSLAITCAAVDDVTAWCLLAVVISIVRSGSMITALPQIFLSIVYIGLMLTAGRWLLARLADRLEHQKHTSLSQFGVALICVGVLCSSIITELLGIHTIFGAFLFGTIVPRRSLFLRDLTEKIEDFTIVLLLPIFFAYTGLRTQLSLLNTPLLWGVCGLIVLVATLGKFGGSAVAARVSGLGWRQSAAIGVLMNTRGLMELVILNIGLDLGVISPALFTMMVIMALVTTFMTTPIMEWIYPQPRPEPQPTQQPIISPVTDA